MVAAVATPVLAATSRPLDAMEVVIMVKESAIARSAMPYLFDRRCERGKVRAVPCVCVEGGGRVRGVASRSKRRWG